MKFSQAPGSVVMVRPASFGFNPQTAKTNTFQQSSPQDVHEQAIREFDRMVDQLRAHDINVLVVQDTATPLKPDAIFPNNWISFHEDGTVILYPMMAENRRLERSLPVLKTIQDSYRVARVLDFSSNEMQGKFLEGTGSVVFDYENKIGYASRSARTDESLVKEVCATLGFKPVLFDAVDEHQLPIYHTNVLMCVGSRFAVLCLDAIRNEEDQERLLELFASTNHQVVAISYAQLRSYAGNMIEVVTKSGEPVVLLSEQAFQSLLPGQINAIAKHAELLPLSVNTIEQFGGGSVRCMVAGIFNPKS